MRRRKQTRRKLTAAVSELDAERLSKLLSTFSTLREDGHALIQRIRGSLMEMRELGQKIRDQRAKRTPTDRLAVSRAAQLERYSIELVTSPAAPR